MEKKKNLCAMIPEELHGRMRQEQETLSLTLAQYVEMVMEEHFKKGGKEMAGRTRTLAFQVPEELFGRVKAYLAGHPGMSQKDFVVGLITRELEQYEALEAGQKHGCREEPGETEEPRETEEPGETEELGEPEEPAQEEYGMGGMSM